MKHDRNAAGLAFLIELRELRKLIAVSVRCELLMGRVNLDHANALIEHAPCFAANIAFVTGMYRSDRKQAVAMFARKTCDPLVDFARESHHLWSDVVDAADALDAVGIEESNQIVRGRKDFFRAGVGSVVDHRQRIGTDHRPGLHMQMNVKDAHGAMLSRRAKSPSKEHL